MIRQMSSLKKKHTKNKHVKNTKNTYERNVESCCKGVGYISWLDQEYTAEQKSAYKNHSDNVRGRAKA